MRRLANNRKRSTTLQAETHQNMMKASGIYLLHASPEKVYQVIHSPGELLAIIPACQQIEQISPTEYRGLISLRLPAIVGNYQTYVKLSEFEEPFYTRFEGQIEGSLGSLKGTAAFHLKTDGSNTVLEYEGQGMVDGPLARLDTRFVEGLAKSLIDQGLVRLEAQLRQADLARTTSNKEENR